MSNETSSRLRPGFLADMQRYPSNGWVAGVCAGIADYFDWKVKLVRLVIVLLMIFTAFWPVFLVYALFWYVMDEGELSDPQRPKWSTLQATGSATRPAAASTAGPTDLRDLKARFAKLDERLRHLEESALAPQADEQLKREFEQLEREHKEPPKA